MSNTVSLIVLIVILAVAAVLAVVVYLKVQRGQWLSSFRLDKARDLTRGSDEQSGPKPGGKPR